MARLTCVITSLSLSVCLFFLSLLFYQSVFFFFFFLFLFFFLLLLLFYHSCQHFIVISLRLSSFLSPSSSFLLFLPSFSSSSLLPSVYLSLPHQLVSLCKKKEKLFLFLFLFLSLLLLLLIFLPSFLPSFLLPPPLLLFFLAPFYKILHF